MNRTKLLGLIALIILSSSAALFSAADSSYDNSFIDIERYTIFRYFRDSRLSDEEFELYFSIDTCTEMVEYLRINYPWQDERVDFDYLTLSSSNGSRVVTLDHGWVIDKKMSGGKYLYTGRYNDTLKDLYEALDIIEILKGEGLEVILSDKKGNSRKLEVNSAALASIASEYTAQRESFSKIW